MASQFDVTIDPEASWQTKGNAVAESGVFEKLDGVRDIKAFKGVFITNLDPAAGDELGIAYEGTGGSHQLLPGDTIFLEVRHPARIRVQGIQGQVLYSWLAY